MSKSDMTREIALRRFRVTLTFFIIGVVVAGITALPLLQEMSILQSIIPAGENGFSGWIATVKTGLEETYTRFPWIAYGTDWLAYGHFAISFFFVAAVIRPAQSRLILLAGIVACLCLIPTAMICGQARGIPFGWRLIDCSFGVLGIIPLLYCRHLLQFIEADPQRRLT